MQELTRASLDALKQYSYETKEVHDINRATRVANERINKETGNTSYIPPCVCSYPLSVDEQKEMDAWNAHQIKLMNANNAYYM